MDEAVIQRALLTFAELAADYVYVCRLDADGRMILEWVSPAFEQMLDRPLLDRPMLDAWRAVLHPNDLEEAERRLAEVVAGGTHDGELRVISPTGEVHWVHDYARPERDPQTGRVVRVVGGGRDVTARHVAEEALQRSRDELESEVARRTQRLEEMNARLTREIADRRRAEAALQLVQQAVDHAGELIALVDPSKMVQGRGL